MSGILAIGDFERDHIAVAIAQARKHYRPWSVMKDIAVASDTPTLDLKERSNPQRIAEIMRAYPSQRVQLGTYDAAISFEEQPAGMFKHLSVSSAKSGKIPGPEVMQMVCEAFGFDEVLCRTMSNPRANLVPVRPARVWVEEFEPGHFAVNVIELQP